MKLGIFDILILSHLLILSVSANDWYSQPESSEVGQSGDLARVIPMWRGKSPQSGAGSLFLDDSSRVEEGREERLREIQLQPRNSSFHEDGKIRHRLNKFGSDKRRVLQAELLELSKNSRANSFLSLVVVGEQEWTRQLLDSTRVEEKANQFLRARLEQLEKLVSGANTFQTPDPRHLTREPAVAELEIVPSF